MFETILLVDDNASLLNGLGLTLKLHNFTVRTASSAPEALEILKTLHPDLIVSDIMMPEMDGFELLQHVRASSENSAVPFLFLTARTDLPTLDRARGVAIDDYITKPFAPRELVKAIRARIARAQSVELAHTTEALLDMLFILARTVEGRDRLTHGHVERVALYAVSLARELGWLTEQLDQVRLAGFLHDLGKIVVPDAILNKPGALDDSEWTLMRQHPLEGARILQPLERLPIVVQGIKHHHERYDGTGYPDGLAGDHIPPIARILAVVDTFDAITVRRSYSQPRQTHTALEIIQRSSGTQFDPGVVAAFSLLCLSPDWADIAARASAVSAQPAEAKVV